MDSYRKIPKKFTKKFSSEVINRQYFHRRTGLKGWEDTPTLKEFFTDDGDVYHMC